LILDIRAGACVTFCSGFGHVHRITPVEWGERYVLALWFERYPAVD